MLIQNGKLYRAHQFAYEDLRIEDGRIVEFLPTCSKGRPGEEVLDVFGSYVIPGMIDLQVHGAAGRDFSDASEEALADMARYLLLHGVTGFLAALDSFPQEVQEEACQAAAGRIGLETDGAMLHGIHLTGPFITPAQHGIQQEAYLKEPDAALFQRLNEKSGQGIKILELSPELPGAKKLIQSVCAAGCMVSLTHSNADYDTARMAYAWGAGMLGDLYRNLPPLDAADPGLIGAAADACRYATLCVDGAWIHPAAVRMAYQLFTRRRLCLTADTSAFAGLRNDVYQIENHQVTVKNGQARFEDGSYAGGIRCLDECVRLTADMGGIPLPLVIDSCTETPARALGIFGETGSIDTGKRADLVVMDLHSLQVKEVILHGKRIRR